MAWSIPLGTSSGDWKTGSTSTIPLGTTSNWSGVQVTGTPQVTAVPQQTAPTSYYQPATNPQPQYTASSSTYQAPSGPSQAEIEAANAAAAQRAAEEAAAAEAARIKAEEEARRVALKGGINKLITDTIGIYDGLFGNVAAAATSQKQLLDQRFNKETGSLTDQFNQELPKIGRSWAGRGGYDSSYRMRGEDAATKGFAGQMEDIGTQYKADAARIGQFQTEEEAKMTAEKDKLLRSRAYVDETTSLEDLTSMRNELDNRIAELEASKGSLMSQNAYAQKAQALAPAADRLSGLTNQLSTLINGQAPGPLKRQVAMEIIGSAGLSKEEEDLLTQQVTAAIG